ncbi:hypothetical protein ACHQM5_012055 [Ranunculus cassubicifolius]
MVPKLFNLKKSEQSSHQEGKKQLHSEIRQMTSALTHHLGELTHHDESEDETGVRIITLAGTNTGATMKGELLDDNSKEEDDDADKAFTTYTNSNFQAINNSIMFGGSYTCKDPGVHIETIMEYDEPSGRKEMKNRKKGKKAVSDGDSD